MKIDTRKGSGFFYTSSKPIVLCTKFSKIQCNPSVPGKGRCISKSARTNTKVEKWIKSFPRETLFVDFKSEVPDNKDVSFSSLAGSFLKPGRICSFFAKEKPLSEGFYDK
ncbi:hypothetical protein [Bacillus siamensis]|uniref:hypothetical protein n=1 Tax=Bacillus siamensis TaxID=659243 RepID=UPI0012FE8934|nr:hypothetical protein [Bacillus siamensis]MED0773218.1 hypothetical protein [Bacillus siamensis]MED0775732.1 hypothetical protein [Bacillus siamensis]MED0778972.1 hypothetical protein [Bacillus siamensis]MED0836023.1 hypothetical protein [Bacillus siamensis]